MQQGSIKRKKTEKDLLWEKTLLKIQTETTNEGMLIVGPNNKIIAYNRAFSKITRVPKKLLATKNDKKILQHALLIVKNPQKFIRETSRLNKDRKTKSKDIIELNNGQIIERLTFPIFIAKGNYVGRIWLLHDVTGIVKAYSSLQQLAAIVNSSDDAIIGKTLKGTITSWNPGAKKLYGYSAAEAIGKNIEIIVPKDKRQELREILLRIARGKHVEHLETTRIDKDKKVHLVSLSIAPLKNNAGKIVGESTIARDITKQKLVENTVFELQQKYADLVKNIKVGVYKNTPGKIGRWIEVNPEMVKMFEANSARDLINHPVSAIYANPKNRAKYSTKLLKHGFLKDEILAFKTLKGKEFLGLVNSNLIKDEQGNSYFYGTIDNITDRKRVELELEQYRNHLEELVKDKTEKLNQAVKSLQLVSTEAETANRAKSAFLANMSHEIRTPLNAVLGYAQLLLRDATLQDKHREYIKIISHSGDHLLALINDILEISKIEAGYTKLNIEDFDFLLLLHDIESMFQIRANEKHLGFEFIISKDCSQCLRADAGKIRQVMMNLISNAIKFTESGKIVIRTFCKKSPKGNNIRDYFVMVKDSGRGIAKQDLKKVFDAYAKDFNGKIKGRGAGLGLTISLNYAKIMGGTIKVNSVLGKGSTFLFSFEATPCDISTLIDISKIEEKKVIGLASEQKPIKVLVVDDNIPNRDVLRLMLLNVGFIVEQASSGKEAILMAKEHQPNVILMDIVMPEIDGIQATKILKTSPQTQNIPVIMITASPFEEEREKALRSGASSFIRKPFVDSEIYAAIGKILNLSYIYEEDLTTKPIRSTAPPRFYSEEMQKLPANLRQEIIAMAQIGSVKQLKTLLINEVTPRNQDLSQYLQELLNNYNYEQIIQTCS